jgi:hypothetical protein
MGSAVHNVKKQVQPLTTKIHNSSSSQVKQRNTLNSKILNRPYRLGSGTGLTNAVPKRVKSPANQKLNSLELQKTFTNKTGGIKSTKQGKFLSPAQ